MQAATIKAKKNPPKQTSRKKPDPLDVEAGARVRAVRVRRGVSQERLGEALGITFQQVQKYEKGTNRISISRLINICKALDCAPTDIVPWNSDGAASESIGLALTKEEHLLIEGFKKSPQKVRTAIRTLASFGSEAVDVAA